MSMPRSAATIRFPAKFLDAGINKELADYYGESENGEPDIEAGIFTLEDGEARDGEFEDLETLLIEKGIPFDRTSYQDWNRPPVLRVFRPGPWIKRGLLARMDIEISLDADSYEPVVSVPKIREVLKREWDKTDKNVGRIAYGKLIELVAYLDELVPPYPPLADYVKETAT